MKNSRRKWEDYWSKKKTKTTVNKERMIKILERYKYKKALDAGCGSGFFSKYFASKGDVIALDYSKTALRMTKKLNKKIKVVRGDVFHIPFKDDTFDLIFSDGLLEHYRNPSDILREFKRILKPEGIIATFVPNKFSYWCFVKPLFLKKIEEYRFTLKELIKFHEDVELDIIESGGFSVFPFHFSPEFLGERIGRIIYAIAKK